MLSTVEASDPLNKENLAGGAMADNHKTIYAGLISKNHFLKWVCQLKCNGRQGSAYFLDLAIFHPIQNDSLWEHLQGMGKVIDHQAY